MPTPLLRAPPARTLTPARGLARDILTSQAASIEGDPLALLKVSDAFWKNLQKEYAGLKTPPPAPRVIRQHSNAEASTSTAPLSFDYDVAVCGGTLGVFVALALQKLGHRVVIVERRTVEGRTQEWNISRHEMHGLVDLGLITEAEAEAAVVSEFNPIRSGFYGADDDIWKRDILNLGVCPKRLIGTLRRKFLEHGGRILEQTVFQSADVFQDGVRLNLAAARGANAALTPGDASRPNVAPRGDSTDAAPSSAASKGLFTIRCRLLLDCMGHYSPIVKQLRDGTKPDGMLLVCGTCADGYPTELNTTADLLYTATHAERDLQYFFEAFPASAPLHQPSSLRTTYMFAYTDAHPDRPSLEAFLDRYFELLPTYQGVEAHDLSVKRVLFGGFPCYANSPLKPGFDRVMQIGDASACQSPLSFGGFGAMVRHLPRWSSGIHEALDGDHLSRSELRELLPYMPSLSAAWLFNRSMGFQVGQLDEPEYRAFDRSSSAPYGRKGWLPPDHINRLLRCNFGVMKVLGDRVLRPFLQDTLQFGPLSLAMGGMMFRDPITILRVLLQVGPQVLTGWFGHYFMLGLYTLLHLTLGQWITKYSDNYRLRRWADAWKFGSAMDYSYAPEGAPAERPPPPTQARVEEAVEAANAQMMQAVVEASAASSRETPAAAASGSASATVEVGEREAQGSTAPWLQPVPVPVPRRVA